MPQFPETGSCRYSERCTRVRPDTNGHVKTHVTEETLVSQIGSRRIDQPVKLCLAGEQNHGRLRRAPGPDAMTPDHHESSAGRLAGPRTLRPVRVAIDINAFGTLVGIRPNQTPVPDQVMPTAPHGGHGRLRLGAHMYLQNPWLRAGSRSGPPPSDWPARPGP